MTTNSSPWSRSISGLGTFLTMLRLRLAFFVIAGSGVLVLHAANVSASNRAIATGWALVCALLNLLGVFGLLRHSTFPMHHSGRIASGLALATLCAALGVDLYALLLSRGFADPITIAGFPFELALTTRTAELVAFVALAPLCVSHARLARSLGAPDVESRGWQALRWVVLASLLFAAFTFLFGRLALTPRLVLAGTLGVAALVAFAKVLGATRYLLAYERTMDLPESEQPAELRAWHRA